MIEDVFARMPARMAYYPGAAEPMLEGIEKVVMHHPLTTFPKPTYFPSHRTVDKLMPRRVALDEGARWAKVPGVVATAMRC